MIAGPAWCDRYPGSRSVADLVDPFRSGVISFIAELGALGCEVEISATWRPYERAWLMRTAWDIAKGVIEPGDAPPAPAGIDIVWTLDGARAMVERYKLRYRPSLTSRHIQRRAIDMRITGWTGSDEALWALGAKHGVIKLRTDPPHWSDDGR